MGGKGRFAQSGDSEEEYDGLQDNGGDGHQESKCGKQIAALGRGFGSCQIFTQTGSPSFFDFLQPESI